MNANGEITFRDLRTDSAQNWQEHEENMERAALARETWRDVVRESAPKKEVGLMPANPAEYAAIWVAMLTEEIFECSHVPTLALMAARLRQLAELAEDRAAELGPDVEQRVQ